MSTRYLYVPMHLDGLWIDQDTGVVNTMADFSKVPWFNGTRDINPNKANISEELLSVPFQDKNLFLKPGLHLHWALPDALTNINVDDQGNSKYPLVPDRWVVVRIQEGQITNQWMVQSNYLFPPGTGAFSGSITIPFSDHTHPQPYRHMGRSFQLDAGDVESGDFWGELTAVGYGEETFASFYPNCLSVFGFRDGELDALPAEGDQYLVIGYYKDPDKDFFHTASQDFSTKPAEWLQDLQNTLGWTTEDDLSEEFPTQMLCYGSLTFSSPEQNQDSSEPTMITVATSGTEAISAYLAQSIDPTNKATLEEQLEALQITGQFTNAEFDTAAQFNEARHTAGFNSEIRGTLWNLTTFQPDLQSADADASESAMNVNLPDNLAHRLNQINLLQTEYDQTQDEIESLQSQLFSDWYKFMLTSYPPEGSQVAFPDIDLVATFLRTKSIPAVESLKSRKGSLLLSQDENGMLLGATTENSQPRSIAFRLAMLLNELLSVVDRFNAELSTGDESGSFFVQPSSSPRYYTPNEPAVLITGDAATPTDRYGKDGAGNPDGFLGCTVEEVDGPVVEDNSLNPEIFEEVTVTLAPGTGEEKEGYNLWTSNPWHPFMLQWEVEMFPLLAKSSLAQPDQKFAADYINNSYQIPQNQPDLTLQSGKGGVDSRGTVYLGNTVLTDFAGNLVSDQLGAYIQNNILPVFYRNTGTPPSDDFLEDPNNVADLDSWYKTSFFGPNPTDAELAADPNYTAIRAFEQLEDLNSLSQSLGGFNAALLQHKQTLQLDPSDPIGFPENQTLTEQAAALMEGQTTVSPQPENLFLPIRTGALRMGQLRLVDNFGVTRDLNVKQPPITTEQWKLPPGDTGLIGLPPRLPQSSRINFRFLSALDGEMEMNSHPASSPINGWVIANNLEGSIAVFDQIGRAVGSINAAGNWEGAPGSAGIIAYPQNIENPYLRQMVLYLLGQGEDFQQNFLDVINTSLDNIQPETFAQDQGLALLMSRPVALIRTSLNLEVKGTPALDQSWTAFRKDLRRDTRDTAGFDQVQFPIRIGEFEQLNDGLVGYWIETPEGYQNNLFFAPQSDPVEENLIITQGEAPFQISQSIGQRPNLLSMLVDPQGAIHMTSGILPTKELRIPPDQYSLALANIEMTFLTAPLLQPDDSLQIPLADEAGFSWSWLENDKEAWYETSEIDPIQTQAGLNIRPRLVDGWLKLKKTDNGIDDSET